MCQGRVVASETAEVAQLSSCELVAWFCMFASSKLAILRNNIVYKAYLFHLALIFVFTYPKLNIKKKIMPCEFSLSCSKSDLYLHLCY